MHKGRVHDVTHCRNDQVRKSGLGSISITSSFRGNLPSSREDRLVLLTMAACVYRNASRHATHRIHQGNSYSFGARFLFWCEQTEFDRVWWSDDLFGAIQESARQNCKPWLWQSKCIPGKLISFLNQYEEAVKRPFGYLLINLKTTTQDNCPLRTNLLSSE